MSPSVEGHTEERRGRGGCYTCRKDELMVDIQIQSSKQFHVTMRGGKETERERRGRREEEGELT